MYKCWVCDRTITGMPLILTFIGPNGSNEGTDFFRLLFCSDECLSVRLPDMDNKVAQFRVNERRKTLGVAPLNFNSAECEDDCDDEGEEWKS